MIILAALLGVMQAQQPPAIVPRPARLTLGSGHYTLRARIDIVVPDGDPRFQPPADLLRGWLHGLGIESRIRYGGLARPGVIVLDAPTVGVAADSEAYDVFVTRDNARLRAGSPTGLIWAVQTLTQLLPSDSAARRSRRIPVAEIHDAPRFPWRGAMLDAGRHFFDVPRVKRFLDLMSLYKLNVMHWHLTEDQGWRIEIPRYPRLTEVGAWRTEADGSRYGGFYTPAQVREVVDYARRRGISVVPEIEMPGHSSAAIAAYPWLGCTNDTIPVPSTWGVFSDVYCVGKPEVLAFLDTVVADVANLFPSPFLHIGGDEVPKDRWHACAPCQALMAREGLHNEVELQSWFTRRMAGVLARHGKRLIGWDEITEGGLPPGVVVQVWRDMAHADSTARSGQDVIASPTSHVYLDYSQQNLPLERVYAFDPVPPGLPDAAARHILGGEAPLWSEQINDANHDLMAFPRLLALAEALWTTGPRDYAGFHARLVSDQYARLRALGVVPGPEDRDVIRLRAEADSLTGRARFVAATGSADVRLRYARDGSRPAAQSPLYDESVLADSGTLAVRAFVGDQPMLVERRLSFASHLARGRPLTLAAPPAARYQGTGPRTLTDGLLGSADFADGLWQGWQGVDLDLTIDLGAVRDVAVVEGSFLQNTPSWIVMPRDMDVMLSSDGTTWSAAQTATHDVRVDQRETILRRLSVTAPPGTQARFVRVVAHGSGPLPAWHSGAGHPSWIFADEIVVR